jgi:hypothetical protein
MPRKYTKKPEISEEEQEIVKLLEGHGDIPVALDDSPEILTEQEIVYGVYKWRKRVYCFAGHSDVPYEELKQEEQQRVLKEMRAGRFKSAPNLQ